MSTPEHDEIVAAAENFMTTLALEEAQEVAIQQARIVSRVIEVLTDVATAAQHRPPGLYDEGYQDGQVALVKRLFELIKKEREL